MNVARRLRLILRKQVMLFPGMSLMGSHYWMKQAEREIEKKMKLRKKGDPL